MKTILSTIALVACVAMTSYAQDENQLKFSRVIEVKNTEVTVPADKVWKITAVTGAEFRVNQCIPIGAADNGSEANGIRCAWVSTNRSVRFSYNISALVVNGVSVPFRLSGFPGNSSVSYWNSSDCSGSASNVTRDWACANITSDPNVLPMWLAAGTTLQTGGPNTIASVIEFTVVPE